MTRTVIVLLGVLFVGGCEAVHLQPQLVPDAADCGLKIQNPYVDTADHYEGCQVPQTGRTSAFIVFHDGDPVTWVSVATPGPGEYQASDPGVFFGLALNGDNGCAAWTGPVLATMVSHDHWQFDFDVTCKKNGTNFKGVLYGNIGGEFGTSP